MLSRASAHPTSSRRGFTITELLFALAALVGLMTATTEAFSAAAERFRDLKSLGDQNEKLRATAATLRRDLADAHFDAGRFILDGLRTGSVNREEIAELRKRYEAIAADADAFDARLEEVEQKLETPAEKRIVRRARGCLDRLKIALDGTTGLLELIERDDK